MTNKFKKITAGALAALAATMVSVSASASTVETYWQAVKQIGAPTSVNRPYIYDVPVYGRGHLVNCTYFLNGGDSVVKVTPPAGAIFSYTAVKENPAQYVPYVSSSTGYVQFKFSALESTTGTAANGKIMRND